VNTAFVDWVQKWPGQVVIGIFNLFWTAEVNEARRKSKKHEAGAQHSAASCGGRMLQIVGYYEDIKRDG